MGRLWLANALYEWLDNFKQNGLTADLRLALRKLLAPKIKIRKPLISISNKSNNNELPTRIRQLVDWDIVLAVDGVAHILRDWLRVREQAPFIPPSLLDEFQLLLRDALDLIMNWGKPTAGMIALFGIYHPLPHIGKTGDTAHGLS